MLLQNFTFNDDFSPSSTSSADLSGLGAEPKTPGLSQSLALSSDEVRLWHWRQNCFLGHTFYPLNYHQEIVFKVDFTFRWQGPRLYIWCEIIMISLLFCLNMKAKYCFSAPLRCPGTSLTIYLVFVWFRWVDSEQRYGGGRLGTASKNRKQLSNHMEFPNSPFLFSFTFPTITPTPRFWYFLWLECGSWLRNTAVERGEVQFRQGKITG